ncbi:MAG TPA: isoaspartyl peptidase/L-asparaginase [Candidatus Bathyarchaeia archaeon]
MNWVIAANASTLNRAGIEEAVSVGASCLENDGSALDAVEATIRCMEDNPAFDAGTGCDINLNGLVLMDASIMDGASLRAGAVGSVSGVKNPVSVARGVMERTSHVLLVGVGAEEFARQLSLVDDSIVVSYDPRTEQKKKRLDDAVRLLVDEGYSYEEHAGPRKTAETLIRLQLDGKLEPLQRRHRETQSSGTVSASALDRHGNYAAGASTGGWALTIPGRIGDSPLIGCGAYADNQVGCASTAGIRGEENARLGGLTRMICDHMRTGCTAQDAVTIATRCAEKRLGLTLKRGTLIAIDGRGGVGVNGGHHADPIGVCYLREGVQRPIHPLESLSN